MKKLFFFFAMICVTISATCANSIFNKYTDMKNAEVISFNFAFMRDAHGLTSDALLAWMDSAQALMMADVINSVDELQVIATTKGALSKMQQDIKTLRNDYQEVFSFKDNNDMSSIFLYGEIGTKHELICYMLTNSKNKEAMTIVMVGDLSMRDVGRIVDTLQSKGASLSSKTTTEGVLPGEFSVSSTKKVQFSKGNLQYQPSTSSWRFPDNQYDYIGLDNHFIAPDYDGWIDLFGFGTGNNPTLCSNENSDYDTFTEWGTNTIMNGHDETNSWRSLSFSEWGYLFWYRKNADFLFGLGEVNGTYGIILLPDNWTEIKKLPHFVTWKEQKETASAGNTIKNWANVYDTKQWAKMEAAGAVLLPCAGYRMGTNVGGREAGNYFSSTPYDDNMAYEFGFNSNGISLHQCKRAYGCSIRLVHDCK